MKIYRNFIFFFLSMIGCLNSLAQKSEFFYDQGHEFTNAMELYNSKMYAGSHLRLEKLDKLIEKSTSAKVKLDYFDAMCAIKMRKPDAEQTVLKFVENHPFNSRKEKIFFNVGSYFFSNRKASHSLQWYSKVNQKSLQDDVRNEMNFKMGYCLLVNKYFADAKDKFSTLLGSPDYGNDARYYYGYISYRQENFDDAHDNFSQLANDATYQSVSSYYLLDIAFKNGDFDKAIKIGKEILPKHQKGQKSDIVKMIGESYFNLGKYKESIPYLLQYKDVKGKWNNTNLYYIGYAYYKQNDYKNGLKYFTKILDGNNAIAQNAYYHLGICYVKLGKKSQALNAFKNAYDMHFDEDIREKAGLNYTKVSYEEGNPYKSSPEILKEYIRKHPKGKEVEEIKELLTIAYLHEHDFSSALDNLKHSKSEEKQDLKTEISLYKGLQLFHSKKYRKAIKYFLVANNSKEPKISNKALFWLAESQYLVGKYKDALKSFTDVNYNSELVEVHDIDYNIGYVYFKMNNYKDAGVYFDKFINREGVDVERKEDAINRLGDSFYALKDYRKAIKNYNIIIDSGGNGADYAMYQRAMSNGLLGNTSDKLTDLASIQTKYEESVYRDDALFQSAVSYAAQKKVNKANSFYDNILENYPNSSYVPTVMLRKGLYYYGINNYENALRSFKKVVTKFPNSEEAKQAITNVRNVYIDKGNIEPYIAWIKTLKHVNISNKEIDDSSYIAAENLFFNNDFITSTISFKAYLKKFPDGAHLLKANYYLAESHYNLDQKRKTVKYYKYILAQEKNEFTEDAISKLSQVYLDLDKWDEAIPVLERLEKEANLEHNVIFAKSNLMKAYYGKNNLKKSKEYAEKVLATSKLDQSVGEDAELIIARVAIKDEDFETAREYYKVIDRTAIGEMKAETLYHKAFFLHEDKLYKESNTAIQNLIAEYSTYKYWGVKSYIIMAKNYFELGDSYQAAYILESVLENFDKFEDLKEEASNLLLKIKNEEAKENESIKSKESEK